MHVDLFVYRLKKKGFYLCEVCISACVCDKLTLK